MEAVVNQSRRDADSYAPASSDAAPAAPHQALAALADIDHEHEIQEPEEELSPTPPDYGGSPAGDPSPSPPVSTEEEDPGLAPPPSSGAGGMPSGRGASA